MSHITPAAPAAANIDPARHDTGTGRGFVKNWVLFLLVGVLLYGLVFIAADQLVYRYAKRNRFFDVKTASTAPYDWVILGASHAAVFDYQDMNAQLEQRTGAKIINLSNVGSGVVINRLLLDYFLAGHQTKGVVYVADSFGFYARDWNEDRLKDVRLFDRAPFDPTLVGMLWQNPASQSIALDYTVGFSKINNPDRFKADVTDDEALRFEKGVYRPVPQIDKQRIDYLYPRPVDPGEFQRYLGEFENLLKELARRNIRVMVMKPPLPERMYKLLPKEGEFDTALKAVLERNGVEYHDYSLVNNEEKYFFNPDHLNKAGVLAFYDGTLAKVLSSTPSATK